MTDYIERSRQAGLTLLEVLISLLVLSLGLAGLATLYLTSLSSVHSGLFTSLASSIALDLEERLWIEVGRNGDGTCPNLNEAVVVLENNWNGSRAGFLSLPGLSIAASADPSLSSGRFQEISLTISWNENRFSENRVVEEFQYATRIYCRS